MHDWAAEVPFWDVLPDDVERSLRSIDRWAERLVAGDLVESFGAEALRALSGAELLDGLENFARQNWDFRGGRERNLADTPLLTSRQADAVVASAFRLGLGGTPPPLKEHYDVVLMTGGMVRAGIVKPRCLRDLERTGLAFGEAVFLGAFRSFAGDEAMLARQLGVDGDNEVDAMTAGMHQAFGPLPPSTVTECAADEPSFSWRDECWSLPDHRLRVVAAPSSDPQGGRANTADTFRFWAARHLAASASVLVITTPVYAPYQAAVAVEVLGLEFGFQVETVAVSARASDLGAHSQVVLPHHQLQELRSAVSGYRSLRQKLVMAGS